MAFSPETKAMLFGRGALDTAAFGLPSVRLPVCAQVERDATRVLVGHAIPDGFGGGSGPLTAGTLFGALDYSLDGFGARLDFGGSPARLTGRADASAQIGGRAFEVWIERDREGFRATGLRSDTAWTLAEFAESLLKVDSVSVPEIAIERILLYRVAARQVDQVARPYRVDFGAKQINLHAGAGAVADVSFWDHSINVRISTPNDGRFEIAVTLLDLGLVSFESITLRYEKQWSRFTLEARPTLMGTRLGSFSATYQRKQFLCTFEAPLGALSLPGIGSMTQRGVTLSVTFEWSKDGGRLVSIGGLPVLPQNVMDRLPTALNRGSTCRAIASSMLDDGLDLSFGLSVSEADGGRIEKVEERLEVGLVITWTGRFDYGTTIQYTGDLRLELDLPIPTQLSNLPKALCQAVVDNADDVIEALLEDPDFYAGLTLVVAKKAGAAGASRMLCRALKRGVRFLRKLLRRLAGRITHLIKGALAEVLKYTSLAVNAAVNVLLALIKLIFDIETAEEREVRDQLEAAEQLLDSTARRLESEIGTIEPFDAAPTVTLDGNGRVTAVCSIDPATLDFPKVAIRFDFLSGDPGQPGAFVHSVDVPYVAGDARAEVQVDASTLIAADPAYRFNLQVVAHVTQFVDLGTLGANLPDPENPDLSDFRTELLALQAEYDALTDLDARGVLTQPRPVAARSTDGTRIGQARVGFTTFT